MPHAKALPSKDKKSVKIYSYTARIPPESEKELMDTLRKGNIYRNILVKRELNRRAIVHEHLRVLDPTLVQLDADLSQVSVVLSEYETLIKQKKSKQRSHRVTAEDRKKCEELREDHLQLIAVIKSVEGKIYKTDAFKVWNDPLEEKYVVETKLHRAEREVYCGTGLFVEEARKGDRSGKPPRLREFEGNGVVAMQLHNGASIEDITSGFNTYIRISFTENAITPSEGAPWRQGYIRTGSTKSRKPIWSEFHVRFTRDLPELARVKWVQLVARRVGTHITWKFQLVLSQDAWPDKLDRANRGIVGIDVGWRVLKNGDIRIATWSGDDGEEGDVIIPRDRVDRYRYSRELESQRDLLFNETIKRIVAWKESLHLPEWFIKETRGIHLWKKTKRLNRLIRLWADQRFTGDAEMFSSLNGRESWRSRDKKLYDKEAYVKRKFINWRKNYYREVANMLGKRYRHCVLELVNWKEIAERDDVLDETPEYKRKQLKQYKNEAAVSHFNDACGIMFRSLEKCDARKTTMNCHSCGKTNKWDHSELHHTCDKCGISWDQDFNASRNLLQKAI